MNKKLVKFFLALLLPTIILFLPASAFPIENITIAEQRVIALFVFAALFWVLEPIPIYATSVMIITLELLMLSDKGFKPLVSGYEEENLGNLLSYKEIMSTFASPIIMLFLGGFFLAIAATKYRLDQNLARVMLKPFGTKPSLVLMGLMIITAVFSMFMSNTATTAMMLSILAPVLSVFSENDKGKIAFALGIPVAANIGGIGTPIGTPPNAIALKYLTGDYYISFGEWMSFAVPYVIILLAFGWFLLKFLFPSETKELKLDIKGKFLKTRKAYIVYATFILTVLLWLTDFLHGMNSYVVALIPVAVFSATSIITKEDLKKISWDVLWLVSGGIALGLALDKTGLALHMVESIPFGDFSPYAVVIGATLLTLAMANFMSHTATANLLMPIIAALGVSMTSLAPLGGTQMLVLNVAFAASLGMSLPISTPPNALASATGLVSTNQMAKVGVIIGIVGLLMTYLLSFILNQAGFYTL